MPGLIDSDTGFVFGHGLQFQDEIGTASFIIGPQGSTQKELFWGTKPLFWGTLELVWGQ